MQTTETQPARGAQQPPNSGGATPPAGATGGAQLPQQPLTPEQTRKMQLMAKQAMGLLLEDATAQQIVKMAQGGDPQQVVAQIVVRTMHRLFEAGQAAGQLDPNNPADIVASMVAAVQIIGDLTEMLVQAGVVQQAQAPQFIAVTTKAALEQHNANATQKGGAA
jgi:hypothetical protein